MTQKFFRCAHCGNLAVLLKDAGVAMVCCGEPMTLLTANAVDASTEKHIPQVTEDGDKITVQIGSTIHPMLEEHHIAFIYLQTEQGGQFKKLQVGNEPIAEFSITKDKVTAVYEYCNLHGLWVYQM